jgi:hypothetical protein
MLYGGKEALDWAKGLVESMNEIDKKQLSYFEESEIVTFPYKKTSDANPALRGIDPPLSLGQMNDIAKQADAIGVDKEKNGWAIAIANFKRSHKIEDGRWVKKESNMSEKENDLQENLGLNKPEKEELFMEEEKEKVAKEEIKGEEDKENSKKEEEKENKKEEKMSLDANLDVATILAMLEDETEGFRQLKASHESGSEDFSSKLMSAMYAKMCKMAEDAKKDRDTYMAENNELKKFKSGIEAERFSMAVEQTLSEVLDMMPKKELDEARDDSKNFSLDTLDIWRNKTKAVAFSFVKDKKQKDGVMRVGLPYINGENKRNSVWDNL